jgi:hypothetical protein
MSITCMKKREEEDMNRREDESSSGEKGNGRERGRKNRRKRGENVEGRSIKAHVGERGRANEVTGKQE